MEELRNQDKREVVHKFMTDKIQRAAKKVIAEIGFQRATLEQIAAIAGISKGTIYLYFENKDDLFGKTIEKLIDDLIWRVKKEAEKINDHFGQLKTIVLKQLEFFDNESDLFKIYLAEKGGLIINPKDEHKLRLKNKYLIYVNFLTNIMKAMGKKGILRMQNHDKMAFMLLEMTNSISLQRIIGRSKVPLIKDAELILNIFLKGVIKR